MKALDQEASDVSLPPATEPTYVFEGDAKWSVFLLLHQFEVGCWRTAPKFA